MTALLNVERNEAMTLTLAQVAYSRQRLARKPMRPGNNAIAFGYGSKALRDVTVAIGTGNVVNAEKSGAFGDPNYIEDKAGGSYAFGNDNRITSKSTFVLGNGVNAKCNNGDVDTEAVTVKDKDGKETTVTVPKALGATVENSVYLGNKSTATKIRVKT